MLPQSKRLSRKEVEEVLKNGRRFSSQYFFATLFRPTVPLTPGPRFAVVVSKKTAGTAVKRNALRRRTYQAIRKHIAENGQHTRSRALPPLFIVMTVKREAVGVDFSLFYKDVQRLLTSAGL